MPKVTDEYIKNKRKRIVAACYAVCLRKPIQMVTMTDVIEESGLSQGGIYRFYSDLDEILRDVIREMRHRFNIMEETDRLFSKAEEMSINDIVYAICDILGRTMEEQLMTVQKLNFDLSVLAINEPQRVAKILGSIQEEGNLEHLTKLMGSLIERECQKGNIKPKADPVEIMQYAASVYSGIEMNCIINACYNHGSMKIKYEPRKLFDVHAKAMIMLMGGEI